MWEAYDLGDEELLWSGVAFTGGIGGQQQAPCGAVSAAAVLLGLHRRCSSGDKQMAKRARNYAREDAGEMVKSFTDRFGAISCRELIGLDFSQPGVYQQFLESGIWKEKCNKYVQLVIEKLYELEEKRGIVMEPQKE